jgi:hypothetical protein
MSTFYRSFDNGMARRVGPEVDTLEDVQLRPMPLVRVGVPFDHSDWVFELKRDGFRALAEINGHHCRLISRHAFLRLVSPRWFESVKLSTYRL